MKTKVLKKLCSFLLVLSMLTSTGIGQAVGELVGTNLTVSAADTLTSSKYPFMKNIPVSPESDFYFYDYYDGGVIIMGYAGNSSEIHIPDAIDGKSVLAISRECFEENEKITHLILPDSLLYAENESFYHCTNLKEIYLGSLQSGLDWHGIEWLLDGCENLQVLSMSDNANFSFAYANNAEYSGQGDPLFHRKTADSLKKIYIGSSMENVPVELFYGNNLEWVEVGKNNKLYSNDKGVVYSADKKTLMVCGTSYPDSEYIIPNGTQAIYRYAFQDCKNIKRLTIPDSVTKISAPFSGCDDLTICGSQGSYAETYAKNNNIPFKDVVSDYEYTVNSDNTVTITKYIGSDTKAVIPSSINGKKVTSIGDNAFYQCSVLTSITIPNSITSIGTEAFYDCKKLTDITIPNGVTSIGVWAFLNCFGLTNITIPDSVTFIGDYAFENCTNLTSINVDTGNKAYSSQNGILFNKNKTAILSFPCAKKGAYVIPDSVTSIGNGAFEYGAGLTSITIPDSVTSIKMGAFLGCTGLTGITIPNSVTVIENWTFRKCSGLKSMTIPDSVTSIGSWAFEYCSGLTSIIIPNSVTSIGLLAFLGCYNLTIYGNSNSYAAAYAAENYIPFTAIEPTPEPKYISDMTITLTPTSFTYDGTAKKPTVTVEEEIEYLVYEIPPPTSSGTVASATLIIRTETEIKKLVEGTDYSLKYENNINAGTAKVTITGMNGYNSSVTKDFTINPKSVANAAITLNPTEYICDGTEKEPTVTVKDNQKMLVSGTDYSVSYSDNVNVGTATVIVTGKKNYTGTAKTTFLIKESSLQFQWGVDNWKFENSDDYILNVPYSEKINSTYLNVLKKNLSYSEYMKIFWGEGRSPALLYTTNGSCYGMSALAFLAKYGFMNFGSYQTNAEKLYDLDAPIKHSLNYLSNKNNVSSLITYYQMLQVKDVIQQKCRKVSNRSNKTNIQEILALLDKNAVVLVGYQWGTEKNSFAHAILAYGYEYAKNSFNGVTYDGYIKIYDPNCSYNDTGVYIYFNKSTYHWIIPGKNLSSSGYPSVKFSCIDADTDDINDGGYLGGNTNNSDSDKFIARIDAPVISKERFVSKMTQSGGTYMNNDDGKNDIIEDYSYILNGNSNGIFGYNLYDPDSAYEVSQKTAADLELHMDYENCDLYGYSSLGKSVIFDKKGFVSIEGETGDYEMAMTFDCDYPTDWFYINVSGTGASDISLLKEKNGYVLSGDHLKKIQICTKNMTDSASIGFSTDYKKVFIYEIDKNTIGLKVDKDNNGTYETSIKGVPILENNSYLSSDSIQLGSTVTVIASGKGGKGSLQYAVYYKKTFESKWTVAQDYNTNTTVSITPAKVTDYDICVKVKDKNGSIEKKYST